jgi:hypothetical protein
MAEQAHSGVYFSRALPVNSMGMIYTNASAISVCHVSNGNECVMASVAKEQPLCAFLLS